METNGNKVRQYDFTGFALAIQRSLMSKMQVADLYIVESIAESICCYSINNQDKKVYCISTIEVAVGDVVLVIFTKSNFHDNLKRYKSEQNIVTIKDDSSHSKNNGIILTKIYSKENENASES